jgi:hypothetical protein
VNPLVDLQKNNPHRVSKNCKGTFKVVVHSIVDVLVV